MILTNKSKTEFYKWLFIFQESIFKGRFLGDEQDVLDEFDILPEICKYALIIEWLDNASIFIDVRKSINNYWIYYILSNNKYDDTNISALERMQDSRIDCTKKAIEKVNDIYNARF